MVVFHSKLLDQDDQTSLNPGNTLGSQEMNQNMKNWQAFAIKEVLKSKKKCSLWLTPSPIFFLFQLYLAHKSQDTGAPDAWSDALGEVEHVTLR